MFCYFKQDRRRARHPAQPQSHPQILSVAQEVGFPDVKPPSNSNQLACAAAARAEFALAGMSPGFESAVKQQPGAMHSITYDTIGLWMLLDHAWASFFCTFTTGSMQAVYAFDLT